MAKGCRALAHAKLTEGIGEAKELPSLAVGTYQEVMLKALSRLSRADVSETVAKA